MIRFCDRPEARTVDFDNSRFVVQDAAGMTIGETRLERGDEVPKGVLGARALRQEYDLPLHRIELLAYAARAEGLEYLREACARRGTALGSKKAEPEPSQAPKPHFQHPKFKRR